MFVIVYRHFRNVSVIKQVNLTSFREQSILTVLSNIKTPMLASINNVQGTFCKCKPEKDQYFTEIMKEIQ